MRYYHLHEKVKDLLFENGKIMSADDAVVWAKACRIMEFDEFGLMDLCIFVWARVWDPTITPHKLAEAFESIMQHDVDEEYLSEAEDEI